MAWTSVEWAALGSMLQGLGTVLGVVAVGGGTYYAANAWREQRRAERKAEMADRILTATHKAKYAFEAIRHPMLWAGELYNAEQKLRGINDRWDQKPEEERKRLSNAEASFNRLDVFKNDRVVLTDCIPLSRALFGRELEQALLTLTNQFLQVHVHTQAYIEDAQERDPAWTATISRARFASMREGEANTVSEAIALAVEIIERRCTPALTLNS